MVRARREGSGRCGVGCVHDPAGQLGRVLVWGRRAARRAAACRGVARRGVVRPACGLAPGSPTTTVTLAGARPTGASGAPGGGWAPSTATMPSKVAALSPVARIRLAWAGCRRLLVIVVSAPVALVLGLAGGGQMVVIGPQPGPVLSSAVPGFARLGAVRIVGPHGSGVAGGLLGADRWGQLGRAQATDRSGVGGHPQHAEVGGDGRGRG